MRSPTARPDLRSFGGWSKSRIRDSLGAPGHSAEFLGESDEDPFRPADVAEPIRVFIADHLALPTLTRSVSAGWLGVRD